MKTTTQFSLHTSRSGIGDFIMGGIHFPHSISSTTAFFFPIMFCSVLLRLAFLFYRKWQVLLSLGAPQYVLVPQTNYYPLSKSEIKNKKIFNGNITWQQHPAPSVETATCCVRGTIGLSISEQQTSIINARQHFPDIGNASMSAFTK